MFSSFHERRALRRFQQHANSLRHLNSEQLRSSAIDASWRLACRSFASRPVLEAFAHVAEAVRRSEHISFYPSQILAGLRMLRNCVVEMPTGEGKTFVAILAAFAHAATRRGCHVMTANDYLAKRDSVQADRILSQLGVTVGVLQPDQAPAERRAAYECDITYGTCKEFAFDHLRDQLALSPLSRSEMPVDSHNTHAQHVQRERSAAIVDEADSILIDQACTPLVISGERDIDPQQDRLLHWSQRVVPQLVPDSDYSLDSGRRIVRLTESGRIRALTHADAGMSIQADVPEVLRSLELGIAAAHLYRRDRDYAVVEGRIEIIDESTGRFLTGRRWQSGLHEAIELKEGIPASRPTGDVARISVQAFMRGYQHVAGMTGTAASVRRELATAYGLGLTRIHPHRRRRVERLPDRVFRNEQDKWRFISRSIQQLRNVGRPILIGTPSIESSERLMQELQEQGIPAHLLHARYDDQEARLIARAGAAGQVTVATNMAGRGTDITVCERVEQKGGLHVIATELHSSRRIDRQLEGRTGRQGQRGSFQQVVSCDDAILQSLPESEVQQIRSRLKPDGNGEVSGKLIAVFRRAQLVREQLARQQRSALIEQERHRLQVCDRLGLAPTLEFV